MAKTDILIGSRPLPPVARAIFAVVTLVRIWDMRRATRRDLRALDDHLLHDIGLPRASALAELQKPFWKA